jgi:catalase (peroxidase I)
VFDHIQAEFNKTQSDDKKVSIALIVLGGCAAIERAAKALVICDSAFTAGGLMHHKNRQMQNHLMC